ncbi:hypothetical protein [Moorena producens]|nr:hypothetical protein [Moorena producens]
MKTRPRGGFLLRSPCSEVPVPCSEVPAPKSLFPKIQKLCTS